MDCDGIRKGVHAFLDGETVELGAEGQRHLRSCPFCRQHLGYQIQLQGMLGRLQREPAPERLRDRILQELQLSEPSAPLTGPFGAPRSSTRRKTGRTG